MLILIEKKVIKMSGPEEILLLYYSNHKKTLFLITATGILGGKCTFKNVRKKS